MRNSFFLCKRTSSPTLTALLLRSLFCLSSDDASTKVHLSHERSKIDFFFFLFCITGVSQGPLFFTGLSTKIRAGDCLRNAPHLVLSSEEGDIREGSKKRIRIKDEDCSLSFLQVRQALSLKLCSSGERRRKRVQQSSTRAVSRRLSLSQLFLFSPHSSTRTGTNETRQHLVTTLHPAATKNAANAKQKNATFPFPFLPSSPPSGLTTSSHTASRRTSVPPIL
jgi:hypothetical protein